MLLPLGGKLVRPKVGLTKIISVNEAHEGFCQGVDNNNANNGNIFFHWTDQNQNLNININDPPVLEIKKGFIISVNSKFRALLGWELFDFTDVPLWGIMEIDSFLDIWSQYEINTPSHFTAKFLTANGEIHPLQVTILNLGLNPSHFTITITLKAVVPYHSPIIHRMPNDGVTLCFDFVLISPQETFVHMSPNVIWVIEAFHFLTWIHRHFSQFLNALSPTKPIGNREGGYFGSNLKGDFEIQFLSDGEFVRGTFILQVKSEVKYPIEDYNIESPNVSSNLVSTHLSGIQTNFNDQNPDNLDFLSFDFLQNVPNTDSNNGHIPVKVSLIGGVPKTNAKRRSPIKLKGKALNGKGCFSIPINSADGSTPKREKIQFIRGGAPLFFDCPLSPELANFFHKPTQRKCRVKRVLPIHPTKKCLSCGTNATPEWRRGPKGPQTLCNACGLEFKKRLNTEQKPAEPAL